MNPNIPLLLSLRNKEKALKAEIISRQMESVKEYFFRRLHDGELDGLNSNELLQELAFDIGAALADEPTNREDVEAFLRRCDELDKEMERTP
jgi:hypothetical protein